MASIHALNKWRCYLEEVKFTVVADHQPNTFLSSQSKLSRRQARWVRVFVAVRFNRDYRPGRSNVADPISRIPQLILKRERYYTVPASLRLISVHKGQN